MGYQFLPRRWYHVALTHTPGSALAPSWVRLYINGALEASERFKFPKVGLSDHLDPQKLADPDQNP